MAFSELIIKVATRAAHSSLSLADIASEFLLVSVSFLAATRPLLRSAIQHALSYHLNSEVQVACLSDKQMQEVGSQRSLELLQRSALKAAEVCFVLSEGLRQYLFSIRSFDSKVHIGFQGYFFKVSKHLLY